MIEDSSFTGGAVAIGVFKFYTSNGVAISNITIRRNVFTAFTGNALDLEVRQLGPRDARSRSRTTPSRRT